MSNYKLNYASDTAEQFETTDELVSWLEEDIDDHIRVDEVDGGKAISIDLDAYYNVVEAVKAMVRELDELTNLAESPF